MEPLLPADWRRGAGSRQHPTADLVACPVGRHRQERGVGIWRSDGRYVLWFGAGYRLPWVPAREAAVVVYVLGPGHVGVPLLLEQTVRHRGGERGA